eukprot:TRINITY_DN1578_c0_g1_i1.p1 TRINITY_DN1578_c0_g1~~TRINITY_DN1578_c0_g1_i1.p1  ORF type:complete len:169 (-),score=31.97 TRINITY_DN1578_c0_g1_i1:187-693(-)
MRFLEREIDRVDERATVTSLTSQLPQVLGLSDGSSPAARAGSHGITEMQAQGEGCTSPSPSFHQFTEHPPAFGAVNAHPSPMGTRASDVAAVAVAPTVASSHIHFGASSFHGQMQQPQQHQHQPHHHQQQHHLSQPLPQPHPNPNSRSHASQERGAVQGYSAMETWGR